MITNVTSQSASPEMPDIRDIKPPLEIPSDYAWVWWVLGAVILMAGLLWLWRWWRKRQENRPPPLPIPAHIRAKEKLDAALALIGQPKPFVVAVSDVARWYLEKRFNFRAPERTSEEFLRELAGTDLLLKEQKESMGQFLAACDLVKFAKYEPAEAELRSLHAAAVKLVEETKPQVEVVKTK